MAKPTKAQLDKINQFAQKEMTEDDIYVFTPMMIDDQVTCYHSTLHNNLLKKFVKDANKGVALLLNHNSRQLPAGRTFGAKLKSEYDEEIGVDTRSLYGEVYIDKGRNTESNMSTDDVIRGIEAGTIFDVSIGFCAEKWTCSICGNDIRDYYACPHCPGRDYIVEENGKQEIQKCLVIVGDDGEGELLELSLVYAGACNRATIKQDFSSDSVRDFNKGTKLSLVDSFKDIPLNAKIYQYYTKDGSVLFTDTDERTSGTEYLLKRSDNDMDVTKFLNNLKTTFSLESDITGLEQAAAYLVSLANEMAKAKEDLSTKETELSTKLTELETANSQLATITADVERLTSELSAKDITISELEKANESLAEQSKVAETYRQDLINQALDLGVKAQGNAFQRELFNKFLSTLSLDEIKTTITGFKTEVENKFSSARITEPEVKNLSKGTSDIPDREENPSEFSAFVAEKAMAYSKENNVSITEATKLMFKKYSSEDRSE